MDRQGGSVSRVLRDVNLPSALLEQPEIVIPLREQFRFLEHAARRTGDAYFGARLGQVVKAKELSAFGAWVCAADTLREAIGRAHAGLNTMLQTSTALRFAQHGPAARWSIEFLEPETEGRRHNEFLGISYMIDLVRTFAGRSWHPDALMSAVPTRTSRAELETIFGTNVSTGHQATTIIFDAALLNCISQSSGAPNTNHHSRVEPRVPQQANALDTIASVTELALYEGYPRLDWVAAKLDMTTRSFQRLLRAHDTTFSHVVRDTILRRARALLDDTIPITEIAFTLGYHDAAHFTRAFRSWTGISPTAYRERARNTSDSI